MGGLHIFRLKKAFDKEITYWRIERNNKELDERLPERKGNEPLMLVQITSNSYTAELQKKIQAFFIFRLR